MTTTDYLQASKKLNDFSMEVRTHIVRAMIIESKITRYLAGIDPYTDTFGYKPHTPTPRMYKADTHHAYSVPSNPEERYREFIETH